MEQGVVLFQASHQDTALSAKEVKTQRCINLRRLQPCHPKVL